MKTMPHRTTIWLKKTMRGLLGTDELKLALSAHFESLEDANHERQGILVEALARIDARLTAAHIDLSKRVNGVPLLDYDTLQAIAAKELEGLPPKDSPFADM